MLQNIYFSDQEVIMFTNKMVYRMFHLNIANQSLFHTYFKCVGFHLKYVVALYQRVVRIDQIHFVNKLLSRHEIMFAILIVKNSDYTLL